MVKDRLYKPEIYGDESRAAGQMTLAYVLERVLKIFAPYLPFVTEEVYSWKISELMGDSSVHVSTWPEVDSSYISEDDEKAASLACDIIAAVRQEKNTEQVSQKHPVQRLVIDADDESKALIESVKSDILMTTSADEIVFEAAEDIELDNGLKLGIALAPKEEKE